MQSQNESKLDEIQKQKKRLRDRIEKLSSQGQEDQPSLNYEENMIKLMQKKKKLQQQKQKQFNFMKMQDEYMNRRKEMERQKRLEQLQNEKRMLELQVGMKKIVFEGVKEKVKGVNSEQLMMRAMLRDGEEEVKKPYTSKGNIRRDFDEYLSSNGSRRIKENWDIYELNEKRLEIFEKKEEAIMRQILLKSELVKDEGDQIDVMKMNRQQLEQQIQARGIQLQDYIIPISKQNIIEIMPSMEENTKIRINDFKKKKKQEEEEKKNYEKYKKNLKEELSSNYDPHNVKLIRSIISKIIDDTVLDYEKRINRNDLDQIAEMKEELQKKYQNVLLQGEMTQFSKEITVQLLEKIHEEFAKDTAEEMVKLNDFAHTKTQECFSWMFGKGTNVVKKLKQVEEIPIELNFQDEEGPKQPVKKNQLKKEKHLSKYEELSSNVFDVDKLTTELINEINLLQAEAAYFKRIKTKYLNERQGPDSIFTILYDRQLYTISKSAIASAKKGKKHIGLKIDGNLTIHRVIKHNNFWIIHDSEKVSIFSPWGIEVIRNEIGERMSNNAGKIKCIELFPIYTVLGGVCSLLLGFEKGQILKYNFNFNRIENSQINQSIYKPLFPQIRSGDDPPFPLDKKNIIKVTNKQIEEGAELHEFRQFFDHHTTSIISIKFYKHNTFISVDKTLKCAIWYYDIKQGNKCYSPAYHFELVPSYKVFKESEDPRFKNIFPGGNTKDTGESLYKKWMQNQTYLKRQIYNNPKKKLAMFKSPEWDEKETQFPIWKISYEGEKVTKIYESFYAGLTGKLQGKYAKIWKKYLIVLCERDHIIREDLKTIKIYSWNIEEKKMQTIGLQVDMFKNQVVSNFQILDSMLTGVDLQLLAVVSSGRILIFSLISGQLVRNLSDPQYLENQKYSKYFFTEITSSRSYLGAATKYATMEICLSDNNAVEEQKQLNDIIHDTQRKYISLI